MKTILQSLAVAIIFVQTALSDESKKTYTSTDGSGLHLAEHVSFTEPKAGKVPEDDQRFLKKFSFEIVNKHGVEVAYVYVDQYNGLSGGQRLQDIGTESRIGASRDELLIEESKLRIKYMKSILAMQAEQDGYKSNFKLTDEKWAVIKGQRARVATGYQLSPKGDKFWMSTAVIQVNNTVYAVLALPQTFEKTIPEGDRWIQSLFKSVQEKPAEQGGGGQPATRSESK